MEWSGGGGEEEQRKKKVDQETVCWCRIVVRGNVVLTDEATEKRNIRFIYFHRNIQKYGGVGNATGMFMIKTSKQQMVFFFDDIM